MSSSTTISNQRTPQNAKVFPKKQSKKPSNSSFYHNELIYCMDQGYCIIDVIFDSNEKPCDYRFIEVNPAFEKQTGLKDAKGKLIKSLKPDHEQFWIDVYGEIALIG